jgi:hypothetical protein
MSKYTSVRTIGRGGFGIVEEVEDEKGNRLARKTFSPDSYIPSNAHDKLRQRFRREVMTQAALGGSEIMPVLDSELDGESPWFVMPLAESTYDVQIATDKAAGSVDINAVADILNDLQFLHEMGYVHRDLNPKNILLHDAHWKLSDFGAVLPPTGQTVTLTEGTIIYTEQYCSPEQRNDFHSAQTAADIYAFGCILHDLFGTLPRTPYRQHSAAGNVGLIIEKCTEVNPLRRPSVQVLRGILLDTLVEIGGHCKVEDQQSEEWLEKLDKISDWEDDDFNAFARFFNQLDIKERVAGHEAVWVYSLSTPFLTRLPAEALAKIVAREDGVAAAIVEKYCQWVRSTRFLFHFSDTVCIRLAAIFDNGTPANKAFAFTTLIDLAESHNRWYIMRQMLRRCGSDGTAPEIGKRLAIEIQIDGMQHQFRRCVSEAKWDINLISTEVKRSCL